VLSKFSPSLKSCLYQPDEGATQDMLNPDHMPKLRNPQMGHIKWDHELPTVQFRIHHGQNDADDIVFSGAKCNKFSFHCQEGGTVIVGFRIQVSAPKEEDVTKLLFMLNKSVKVSLIDEIEGTDDDDLQPQSESSQQSGGDLVSEASDDVDQNDGSGDEIDEETQYQDACAFARGIPSLSVSMIMRGLKVSGIRAQRLIERMHGDGYLGDPSPQGLYEVLTVPA